MKRYLTRLVTFVILGLLIGYTVPVFAQDSHTATYDSTQTSSSTQTTDQKIVSQPTTTTTDQSSTLPGAVGLFFRDIGQRIQLLFTFDPVTGASKRLEFANSNLALARQITEATQDPSVQARAMGLFSRANDLVAAVNDNQAKWSAGDPTAVSNLVAKAQAYMDTAKIVVASISRVVTADHQVEINALIANLNNQNDALVKFIQEKKPDQNTKTNLISTTSTDRDRDGIPDQQETDLGTKSTDFDSDGDGLSDRAEIEKYGTDPNNPDTDGDGFRDGLEVLKGYNPNGSGMASSSKPATLQLKFLTNIQVKPTISSTTLQYITTVLKNYEIKKK